MNNPTSSNQTPAPKPDTPAYFIDQALEILSRLATSAEKLWAWSILKKNKWLDPIVRKGDGIVLYDPNDSKK